MIKITYMTATYNRANLLPNLYESLKRQTDKNFNWLIVDDGSKDNTKDVVESWVKEGKVNIEYIYKENGGKNTAMDLANSICKTGYICYVDSDDYLTDDCTEVLNKYCEQIDNKDDVVGIVGRRAHYDGTPFNTKWSEGNDIVYFYDIGKIYGYTEDTVLIFKTDIIKNFHFPSIPEERFVTESVFYQQFLYDYKIMMIPECVYLAEYQEVGYTSQGMDLFFKNPKGYLYALKQNLFYNLKHEKSFRRKVYSSANLYAWKGVLKIKDDFKNDYKIKFPYNFIGWGAQILLKPKLKKKYQDFLNRQKGK